MPDLTPPDQERPADKPRRVQRMPKCQVTAIERANKVRLDNGIRLLKIKVKPCLACGSLFETATDRTCGCLKLTKVLDIR